jgi:hypothetical protein
MQRWLGLMLYIEMGDLWWCGGVVDSRLTAHPFQSRLQLTSVRG